MAQIQNFGFVPRFQELNVSDTPHEGCRYRQYQRLTKGDEPALCNSGYSEPYMERPRSYVPLGYGSRERPYRTVCDVQVP